MDVIWGSAGPMTAAEVVARLRGRVDWSPRTIKTLLGRLLSKGVLSAEAAGRKYVYHADVKRESCVREETRTFVDRVFGGSSSAMLSHFVHQAPLSADEIAELRAILDAKSHRPSKRRHES